MGGGGVAEAPKSRMVPVRVPTSTLLSATSGRPNFAAVPMGPEKTCVSTPPAGTALNATKFELRPSFVGD